MGLAVVVPAFGPESINVDSAGNLYVSSIGDGAYFKVATDRITAQSARPRG